MLHYQTVPTFVPYSSHTLSKFVDLHPVVRYLCLRRSRLQVDPANNALLLAEPTHNSKEVRERTVQEAFESLG